jgi:hypothetical protein
MFESIRHRNLDLLKLEAHLSSYQPSIIAATCGFGSEHGTTTDHTTP